MEEDSKGDEEMTFLAIKHIPTGHFLPEYGSRKGRGGYTNDEPQNISMFPPRIFRTRTAAINALRWWLEGISAATYSWEGEYDGCTQRRQSHRKAEEMKIVEVIIKELKL